MEARHWTALGALLGGLAVLFGAFGAHALADTLEARGTVRTWETAVQFLGWSGLGLIVYGVFRWSTDSFGSPSTAGWFALAGTVCFSGSLFALALGAPKWLGPVTPVGGILLFAGWMMFARESWRKR